MSEEVHEETLAQNQEDTSMGDAEEKATNSESNGSSTQHTSQDTFTFKIRSRVNNPNSNIITTSEIKKIASELPFIPSPVEDDLYRGIEVPRKHNTKSEKHHQKGGLQVEDNGQNLIKAWMPEIAARVFQVAASMANTRGRKMILSEDINAAVCLLMDQNTATFYIEKMDEAERKYNSNKTGSGESDDEGEGEEEEETTNKE